MSAPDEESFTARLRASGLEVLGLPQGPPPLGPESAWQLVMRSTTEPAVVIDDEQEGFLGRVEASWRRIATEHGILGGDGVFLVTSDQEDAPWALVRDSGHTALARHLAPFPGQPEFVSLSRDGRSLCAVTTEEEGIWVVALRPLET